MKAYMLLRVVILISVNLSQILSQLLYQDSIKHSPPAAASDQIPFMSDPSNAIPAPPGSDKPGPDFSGDVIISDVIGKERTINIFAGFTRDIDGISKRLDDGTQNTTVLAPLNSALQKLPRKPWEDAKDYSTLGESAYAGSEGEERAHMNLRRFVEAHVVPVSPWKEGEKVKAMDGREIWWEETQGKRVVSICYLPSNYVPS